MGNCCSNQNKQNNDINLKDKGKTIPLATVIKAQSLMRGFLARRRVKRTFGFEASPGIMHRRKYNPNIQLDPVRLEQQRARVKDLKNSLPPFEFGLVPNEDDGDGV